MLPTMVSLSWWMGFALVAAANILPRVTATKGLSEASKRAKMAAGFTDCIFWDDFSDQSPGFLTSSSKWAFDIGTSYPGGPPQWGTGESQTYTRDRSNIIVTDQQTLLITPIRLADGTWTSSRIETKPEWDFECQRGRRVRVEARIRLGNDDSTRQLGIWPAFWALGSAYRGNYSNWPGIGEIDLMESVNGENRVWRVAHCGVAPGGPCNEFSGLSDIGTAGRGDWHTFAWEVDRRRGDRRYEKMTWSVDDAQQWTLRASDVSDFAAWDALVGNSKMLLLNVAIGGALPDAAAGIKTPTDATQGGAGASMEVEHVAVYEQTMPSSQDPENEEWDRQRPLPDELSSDPQQSRRTAELRP